MNVTGAVLPSLETDASTTGDEKTTPSLSGYELPGWSTRRMVTDESNHYDTWSVGQVIELSPALSSHSLFTSTGMPANMVGPGSEDGELYEELTQSFFEFENKHDVFDLQTDGINVWEWLRVEVQTEILKQREVLSMNPSTDDKSLRSHLKGLGLWGKNIFSRNPFFSDPIDRLYWGHQRRKQLSDNRWWDIYCDPIHEVEGSEYLHIEGPYNLGHLTPARTDKLRYIDFIHYTGRIGQTVSATRQSLTSPDRSRLKELESKLFDTFGVEIDLISRAEDSITYRAFTRPLYRRFLRRIDPEVVIVVVSYGKETFIEVCKELDIPVVELQHGGFGPSHPGYSFPNGNTKETYPDYLFSFGQFWKDNIDLPIPRKNVVPIGYPYLQQQRQQYQHVEQKEQILFLSQWTIGDGITRSAAEFAEREERMDVVVKLHPAEYDEWRSLYPWLVDAPLTVIDSDDPPLYELLSVSKAQVGVYTTVVYEGLNFELDTYLLDLPGVSQMKHLIQQGGATLVSNVDELLEAMQIRERADGFDVEYFFEPDPLEKFELALESVVSS